MNRRYLIALGVVAVVAAGAGWFYFNFERTVERREVGFQGEARRNFMLAATRLFERMGKKTRIVARPSQLADLPPGGTLVLARYRAGMSARSVDSVMAWVNAGGHLIVAAEWAHSRDPILDLLKIERRELRPPAGKALSEIALPHAPRALQVRVGNRVELAPGSNDAVLRVEDRSSVILLHYRRGAGQITVLNSMSWLTNATIGEHDHAEFAWQLLRFSPGSPEIVIVPRLETPSLFAALAEHASQALIAAALLLAFWLWRIVPRFGPLVPDPLPARRRLLDHLRASGLFQWSHGQRERLTNAAREACMRHIARTHPAIVALPVAARATQLARMSGMPEDQVLRALTGQPADRPQFTAVIRTLQSIATKLTRRAAQ